MAKAGESSSRKRKGKETPKFVDYRQRPRMPEAQKQVFDRACKSTRKMLATKFFHRPTLDLMGITHIVRDMLENVGLGPHLTLTFPTYVLLTQEFLGTLEWVYRYNNKEGEEPTIGFRLRNQYHTMDIPYYYLSDVEGLITGHCLDRPAPPLTWLHGSKHYPFMSLL